MFHTVQNPNPVSSQTSRVKGIFMKHTPTSSRLTVPSWVNPQGWPPGSARRPPGIHCAGHDSPFGHHPQKGKRVPQTPATCPDTPAHCPCHFPSLFMPFPSPPNVPTLPHAYPTPHFSKPRPDPFPPPWRARGSSRHHRSLLGMDPSFFLLVCNSVCMCVCSLSVHVILPTPIDTAGSLRTRLFCYTDSFF